MGATCSGPQSICSTCTNTTNSMRKQQQQFLERNLLNCKLLKLFPTDLQRIDAVQQLTRTGIYQNQKLNDAILYRNTFGYYEGEVLNGEAHGKGRLVLPNYNVYDGEFRFGRFWGRGILKDVRSKAKNQFKGVWEDGLPTKGNLIINGNIIKLRDIKITGEEIKKYYAEVQLPNKMKYIGDLVQNKNSLIFEGKGKMKFPSNALYHGSWKNGKFDGQGKYIWQNGNYYEGQYENGKKHGRGKMYWKNLNKYYSGLWVGGKPGSVSSIRSSQLQATNTNFQPINRTQTQNLGISNQLNESHN